MQNSNTCMTEQEIKIMLDQPNISTLSGLRDRTIMEVLYSTGMRASELRHLKIADIDFAAALARINYSGKWKSQLRVVPIGRRACEYVNLYLKKVRPVLTKENDEEYIFLSIRGNKLKHTDITKMIRTHLHRSGLKKKITPYSFRITCAIHMLLYGSDITCIHKLLGQKNIFSNTGDYSKLSTSTLKEAHLQCHPGEKILLF